MTNIPARGRTIAASVRRGTVSEWVVCIHGLQTNRTAFDDLLARPFFKRHSVLALDCIGFGDSEKPDDFSYDLWEQAELCVAVLEELRVERCHLVGHSMGGMIGTFLLGQLGARVSSFVNMEGNLVMSDCGKSADVARQTYEDFEKSGYAALKAEVSSSKEPSAALRSACLRQTSARAFQGSSVSIVEWSKSERLVPLFNDAPQRKAFLYGSTNARKVANVGKSVQAIEIPDAGHFMMCDNPKETYESIEGFIGGM